MLYSRFVQFFVVSIVVSSVASAARADEVSSAGKTLASGIDRSTFDMSVKPGENFFQYVNGNWIKENPIPAEYTRWGVFMKLRDDNLAALRTLVEELEKSTARLNANAQKLRDFYKTAMDEAALEKQGAKPLDDWFKKIAKVENDKELITLLGQLHATGVGGLFDFGVGQDEKQSSRYASQLYQGGLGLPDRDYYLGTTDDSKRTLQQYREHVAKMFTLLGDAPEKAAAEADTVIKIETQLAEASRKPVELRDREANYNKFTLKELAELTPNINWQDYFKATGIEGVDDVIVGQPDFLKRVNEMVASVSPADWQTYLRWHLIHSTAAYLSEPFEKENFHFYGQQMRGAKEQQPRWKRAIATIDHSMGEALGQLYVEKYFTPAAKKRMDELVKNLMLAYKERIESRDWMGSDTKQQALAKLATVHPKIGYPDKWRDYSALEIKPDSYVENVLRARAFETHREFARLHKPVDRGEWDMTPPTVNAYYNPVNNEIVFPAGILQPPFFNPKADDAVNYGSIGAVIGHEITHGFDDQGSRSDADGNLRNWCTAKDRANFTDKAEKLVKQYEACLAVDKTPLNGKLTLGENLADLGGVNIAYTAYLKSLGGKPAPVIDGFTGPQRFFIGYAQSWCESVRDAEERVMLRTNPHSPDRFRTLVPLSNVQAFYEAFDVKPSDTMYRAPEERVEVW